MSLENPTCEACNRRSRFKDPPPSIQRRLASERREQLNRTHFGRDLQFVRYERGLDLETWAIRLEMTPEDLLEYESGKRPLPAPEELDAWARQLGITDEEKLSLRMAGGYPVTPEERASVTAKGVAAILEMQSSLPKPGLFQIARFVVLSYLDSIKRPFRK